MGMDGKSFLLSVLSVTSVVLSFLFAGCAFDPLGMTYRETPQNKALRLRNEEAVREYWAQKHIDPDDE
jgi:P pilus assembly chaperone PapD